MSGPRWARWAVLLLVLLGLACVRGRPLGDGPPRIDGRTTVLGTFDPSNSILQTGGGLDLGKVPRAELPEPAIVEWGPIGETSPGMNVQLRFNRPMIPIGERPQIEPGVFTIEPPVAGELEWQDPTRLVFRPHEPLPIATTFTVNFAVRVPNGEPLARTWNFTTTRPQLDMQVFDERLDGTWMTPHPHHRIPVLLSSTQPLRRDALIEHLRAEARDPDTKTAAAMDVEVDELGVHRNGDHRFLIRPHDRWPAARQIVLTVDAKLTGEAGPASIGQPLVYSFENPEGVSVHPPICVEASHHDGCELGPVALDFSEPIDARQARHVRVHPEPPGFGVVAADELEQRGARGQRIYEHLIVWGDFERGVEYTLTIDPALRDVHGQALVGERKLALHFVEPTPSLELDAFDRTLDLAGPATVGVESRHVDELELTLAVLTEAEHERMLRFEYYEQDFPTDLTDLHRQRIKLTHTGSFGWSAHTLDLSSFTQGKPGVLAFELRAGALTQSARGLQPPRRYGLVQLTRLGVTVVGALSGGFVRVARLQDDAPVAGASVELIDKLGAPQSERRLLGHTDARGRLALPSSAELGRDSLLRVREGDDQVLIEIGELSDVTHRERDPELRPHESVRTALMSERPLYLPGETLHVLGWAAIASPYELLGLRPLPEHTKVELSVHDPHGTVVAERTVVAKRHGKFWASLQLPAVGALGRYTVGAKILGEYESHEFQLSEVRPPDFELSAAARNTDIGPGEVPQIELEGTYLFGGSVPIEHAWHSTECSPGWYRPPNVPDGFSIVADQSAPHDSEELFPSGEITRSSRRVHYELGPAPSVSGPLSCMHWVTAADANARSTNTSTSFLVHPPSYLALSTPEAIELGEQLPVAVRALLPDGSAAKLERVELTLRHTPWGLERPAAPQRCRASVVDDMAKCRLRPRGLGEHELELRVVVDGHERVARERLYVDEPELLEHVDEEQHLDASTLSVAFEDTWLRVGEVAKLDVRTSWPRGHALVLLGKSAVHQLHELEIENGHATLELETDDTWIPGVEVTVLTVQPGVPPRLIRDEARLHVASNSRSLSVILRAPEHASTREQIPIDVEVGDAAGRPVSGHVAVWAIDEAILALEPLNIRSLTSIFAEPHDHDAHVDFGDRYAKLLAPHQPRPDPYSPRTFDPNWMRGVIGLGHTGLIGRGRGGGGTGDGTIGLGSTPMRSNFSSAPFFIADAKLDSQGRARVLGKLPDNLTTFRIVALASAPLPGHKNIEGRSGVAEARVRVTRPLVVRANLPRVLRPGDQAELGVVIDNRSEHDGVLELDVALHGGDGVAALLGATRTRVLMPAGAQISLPFALQGGGVGESMLEIQARLLGEGSFGVHARDGLRTPLQIEPEPAATERVAIYGSMTDDVAMLPLALPADLDPRHGGLRVAIGGSLLAGLSDAAADLFGSRHASAEQIASRLLALVLVAERDDFPPLVADPDQHVAVAVDQLVKLQRPDGGFAELAHDRESSPVTSAYVVMVLARAERAGFSVSPYLLMRAPGYLEAELERWLTIPGPTLKQDIEAALLLRARAFLTGAPPDVFSKLFERRARLPLFARVQLLLAILDDDRSKQRGARISMLVTELLANVEETAASARTVSDTGPWVEYWDSSARTNALLLEALLRARPEHPLVFKLVRGLLDARVRGRWASSQENAYALLALLEYAAIHETRTPRFDGRVWLGNSRLAQIEVGGDATGFAQDFTPMTELIAASTDDATALILERAGVGRMHYRVGLDWASTDVDRPAVSAGLELRRELRSPDGLLGEQQHVALGSLLALDITVEAEHALDDLAIEVPLPGGLEAMQVANYVTSKLGGERGGWVVHLGLHHDRVVLLADHLEPGAYTTTVFLRAITAGDYRMPAAQAEMIYYPEIHARTTARRVVID